MSSARTPAVYLSHGAPPPAHDPIWPEELSAWAANLPRPRVDPGDLGALGERPVLVSATRTVPLYYDFWGFPKHYYEVTYPAPGAPALAESVRKLLGGQVHEHAERGLDHGAYVPLVEAPAARTAHPRTEHFAPLFVTLGAGESDLAEQRSVIEGFWGGLAKRSVQLG
jgi:4,5-DOPA dioxygenase extradiol